MFFVYLNPCSVFFVTLTVFFSEGREGLHKAIYTTVADETGLAQHAMNLNWFHGVLFSSLYCYIPTFEIQAGCVKSSRRTMRIQRLFRRGYLRACRSYSNE